MPEMNPARSFSQQDVPAIKQQLAKLDLESPVNFAAVDERLHRYFDLYGFNRMPSDCDYCVGYVAATEYSIITHVWLHPAPKGSIFVAHGLFDHVGLYLDVIERLLCEGFSVTAFDFPGHGLSEGEPVTIDDFDQYGLIIRDWLKQIPTQDKRLPEPQIALGQSTGCAALMNYVLVQRAHTFKKLFFLAPLIEPKAFYWINLAYVLLHKFINLVPRSFSKNSHNEDFVQFLERKDPLQCRHISVAWLAAMRQWTKTFDSLEPADIETYIYQGDADQTVDWKKNIPRIRNKLKVSEVFTISGGMHHLVKESDSYRQPMLNHIVSKICV